MNKYQFAYLNEQIIYLEGQLEAAVELTEAIRSWEIAHATCSKKEIGEAEVEVLKARDRFEKLRGLK